MIMLKTVIKTLAIVIAVALLAYVMVYLYFSIKAMYIWQCKIYTGEMSSEGQQICSEYRAHKGIYKLL
jgi:hypothetical protein